MKFAQEQYKECLIEIYYYFGKQKIKWDHWNPYSTRIVSDTWTISIKWWNIEKERVVIFQLDGESGEIDMD